MRTSRGRHFCGCAVLIVAGCLSLTALAAAPAGRYTISAGTVYDTKTKLTWQQTAPTTDYTWTDAKNYCAGVGDSLGGQGWRMPTVKELVTLLDYSEINPAIDPTAFPSTPLAAYWTITALAGVPNNYYLVDFGQGLVLFAPSSTTAFRRVRCVR